MTMSSVIREPAIMQTDAERPGSGRATCLLRGAWPLQEKGLG